MNHDHGVAKMKQQTGTSDPSFAGSAAGQPPDASQAIGASHVRVYPQAKTAATGHTLPHHDPASMPSHETRSPMERANPLVILGAITLGIPILAMMLVIGANSGVQEGTLGTLTTFVVLAAFVVAAIFEIKRLADLPSDQEHP